MWFFYFNVIDQDENLKYIEDETAAEVVAAAKRAGSKTELLLCARYYTLMITINLFDSLVSFSSMRAYLTL